GQFGGSLGRSAEPLVLTDVDDGPSAMRGLEVTTDVSDARRQNRQALLDRLEHAGQSALTRDPEAQEMSRLYHQAQELLSSPPCRLAFDLNREKESMRDRYGRYRSGQACLLARRLVEAGVPFITVFLNHSIRGQDKTPEQTETYGWDTHNDIFVSMKS